jgi:beta-glucosidase
VITPGISSGPALPSSFLWGASSGAYQIEGGNVSSDWWWREHGRLPGPPVEAPSGDAADSYHRYAEDMRLLAEAGLTAYRFSVEWARVQPERNFLSRAAIDHYRRMVDTARELGLEPVITLHHITHPAWFTRDGGWQAPDAVDLFGRYVEALSPLLAEVRMVCTINEPNMVAGLVASDGRFQPLGLPTPKPEVSESLLAAHWRACELVRAAGSAAGWSIAAQALHPDPDAEDAALAYAWPTENVFLNAARDDDWVGVQSYTRLRYTAGGLAPPDEAAERTMVGWEYYPAAVGTAIRNAARCAPGIPIYVTENGIATADDTRRIAYIDEALDAVASCIEDGIEVRGYFHFCALDGYEWGSYQPRFGLIAWSPDTFERRPKPSLAWFGRRAAAGQENSDR